nr:unnamed protein product [Spirometra erinaceieuropaei]
MFYLRFYLDDVEGSTAYTRHVVAGETAHLSFPFRLWSLPSRKDVPPVAWVFTPLATNGIDVSNPPPTILLEAEFPVSRFSKTVRPTNCTDSSLQTALTPSPVACYEASLSISNTLKADEGWYTGRVPGAEPPTTSVLLLVNYQPLQATASLIPE